MKKLHKQKLSDRTQSREIEPVVAGSVLNVFSVFFDASEGITTKTGQLQHHELAIRSFALVDI